MAVGERRNVPYQDANIIPFVAALTMMQQPTSKTQHSNNYAGDEQTVPKGYREQHEDNLMQEYPHDPFTTYGHWYNNSTYPLNHNVVTYPLLQPAANVSPAQGTKDECVPNVTRQVSLPSGTELLEQYINNSGFEYDQVLDNLDCTEYENIDNFSLEDYVDLEKVNFPPEENINFDVVVKQEKQNNNVDILNNPEMNTNSNNECYNIYPTGNIMTPTVGGSDQTLEEPSNVNFTEFLEGFYPSPNHGEWQPQQVVSSSQLPSVCEQIVKTEPDKSIQKQCELMLEQQENNFNNAVSPELSLPDDELIEMPVSRFNELLTSFEQEQSNLAKDIRRRGKNKKAARLCRKRKIDNISSLEDSVCGLEDERNRLLEERKQIVSETDELKRKIDSICDVVIKGLNSEKVMSSSDISVFQHSNGQTLLLRE